MIYTFEKGITRGRQGDVYTLVHEPKPDVGENLNQMSIITKQSAFTLVELSIVIVVIGLVAGGILVGKDLIKAAEIRSQVAQLTRYDQAAATFKIKYGYLPGDLPQAEYTAYSFNAGAAGDGNGLITNSGAVKTYPITGLWNEGLTFTRQLWQTKLIDGYMGTGGVGVYVIGENIPKIIFREYGFQPTSGSDTKLYWFLGINSGTLTNDTALTNRSTAGILTPYEAYGIDQKMDDGTPTTGKTYAVTQPNTRDTTSNSCITDTTTNTYNIVSDLVSCRLMVGSTAR